LVYLGVNNEDSQLGLGALPLADGLPLSPWIDAKDSWADSDYNLSFLVAQQQYPLLTFLVLFH
jgi:hypothetical protein